MSLRVVAVGRSLDLKKYKFGECDFQAEQKGSHASVRRELRQGLFSGYGPPGKERPSVISASRAN